jgi:hypothetical protein
MLYDFKKGEFVMCQGYPFVYDMEVPNIAFFCYLHPVTSEKGYIIVNNSKKVIVHKDDIKTVNTDTMYDILTFERELYE